MKLLLVRHSKAEDTALAGGADEERSLSQEGRRMMEQMALEIGGRLEEGIDKVLSSPYRRALETADIIGNHCRVEVEKFAALSPLGSMEEVLRWLRAQPRQGAFILVGHEPMMSHLTGWLLSGKPAPEVEYRPGTACLLTCAEDPRPGSFSLLWCLPN